MAFRFHGNCPGNANDDARYKIKWDTDTSSWSVKAEYCSSGELFLLPTVRMHTRLVALVNEVKIRYSRQPGGSFYINEWRQVVVPTDGRGYYVTEQYFEPLIFEWHGVRFSGDAVARNGRALEAGEAWIGLHHGIPYTLTAGAQDISYDVQFDDYRVEVRLSDFQSPATVKRICRHVAQFKPPGRFYINEFLHMFAPITVGERGYQRVKYIYLGKLDSLTQWFPMNSGEHALREHGFL